MKPHPRLFMTAADQARIEKLAETDETLAGLIRQNMLRADRMLDEPPSWYEIPDGKRLLGQSRRSIERTSTLAMAYRLTGERKYADKAIEEMLAVGKFKDWNPSHFLDVAEMTTAVAIGYDWLYDILTDEQRKEIRRSIVELGLLPGKRCYEKGGWWTSGHNNWNQVCNGGLTLGALAIAEDERELAEYTITAARKGMPNGLSVYKPDGAYPEGPGYWNYGTGYTVLTMMGLRSAIDDDLGISKAEGLDRTGDYFIHMIGSSGIYFNYADCGSGSGVSSTMFGLARIYDKPFYSWWHRERAQRYAQATTAMKADRFFPMEICWYDPRGEEPSADQQLATGVRFRGVQDVAAIRSDWEDPDAVFLGIKGGNNRASHGHLDVGSFVLDAKGIRWVVDMGADNYNMPSYFGSKRWTYYRLTNYSHSTLTIGGKLQNTSAVAPITRLEEQADGWELDIDMTPAYEESVESAVRRASMRGKGDSATVTIRDTIKGVKEEVRWAFVTSAKVEIAQDGRSLTLLKEDEEMTVKIDAPADARFEMVSTKPPLEIERQNEGYRMPAVFVDPDGDGNVEISVTFTP